MPAIFSYRRMKNVSLASGGVSFVLTPSLVRISSETNVDLSVDLIRRLIAVVDFACIVHAYYLDEIRFSNHKRTSLFF